MKKTCKVLFPLFMIFAPILFFITCDTGEPVPPVPDGDFLRIDHPVSVAEYEDFPVTLYDGQDPVRGVEVHFLGQEKTTDQTGTVIFCATNINWTKKIPLTAHKSGYSESTSRIIVHDADVPPYPKWQTQLGAPVYHFSPTVHNDRLYVATDAGVLWALSKSDGEVLGQHDFGNVILSSPVVEGNELFICANEKPLTDCTQTQGTVLHMLNADDLTPLSSHESSTPLGVLPLLMCSSPAVSGDWVYYGSVDGKLYAFNRIDGAERWPPYDAGSRIYSKPAVEGGSIFFIASDGEVHCVGEVDGQPVWTKITPYVTDICLPSRLAVSGPMVFVPSTYGVLYALDVSSGNEIWSHDFYDESVSIPRSPVIADGRVFVSTAPPPWLPASRLTLSALDEMTGTVLWDHVLKVDNAGLIPSSPTVDDERLYIACGGSMFSFDHTGELIWEMENVGKVYGSAAVDEETVFIGSANGNVYAFHTRVLSSTAMISARSGYPLSKSITSRIKGDAFISGKRSTRDSSAVDLGKPYDDEDTSEDREADAFANKNTGQLWVWSMADDSIPGSNARAHVWSDYTWGGTNDTDLVATATVRINDTKTDTTNSAAARLHLWLRVQDTSGGDPVSELIYKETQAEIAFGPVYHYSDSNLSCPVTFRAKTGHTYRIEVWAESNTSAYEENAGDYSVSGEAEGKLDCSVQDLTLTMKYMPFVEVNVTQGDLRIHDTYDVYEEWLYSNTRFHYDTGYYRIEVSAGYYDPAASYLQIRVPVSEVLNVDLNGLTQSSGDAHTLYFTLPDIHTLELHGGQWSGTPTLDVDGEISGPQLACLPGQLPAGQVLGDYPDPTDDVCEPVPFIGDLYIPDPYLKPELKAAAEAGGVELFTPSSVPVLDLSLLDPSDLYNLDFLRASRTKASVPSLGTQYFQYQEQDLVRVWGYVYNGGFTDVDEDIFRFNVAFDVIPRANPWPDVEPYWGPDGH